MKKLNSLDKRVQLRKLNFDDYKEDLLDKAQYRQPADYYQPVYRRVTALDIARIEMEFSKVK